MYGWLSRAGEDATHVVTASRRLARVLTDEYNLSQLDAGLKAWRTPAILSYAGWLARLSATVHGQNDHARINAQQSRVLWERVLRQHINDPLINIGNLCRDAREAWQRIHEWRVPLGKIASEASGIDQRIFARAANEYRALLRERGWIDDAMLVGHLYDAIETGAVELPEKLLLAGFDRLTPATEHLIDKLRERGTCVDVVSTPAGRQLEMMTYEDADAELRAAGAWARDALREDPSQKIGIVVSGLEQDARRAGRLVREGFVPGWQYGTAAAAASVNVSFGRRLTDYPAIEIALLLLAWTCRELESPEVSVLLRTPYLGRNPAPGRSRLELQLREIPDRSWSIGHHLGAAREASADVKDWLSRLSTVADLCKQQPRTATPSSWAGFANTVLDTVNWPGDHALDSADFQLVDRWRDLLNELAKLELVVPDMSMSEAFGHLASMAAESVFQPEAAGGAVQVMGPLEAAGMSFDQLWISGLSANQWPPPGRPLALLSRNLQREFGMPDAEPGDTIRFAGQVLARLLGSATSCACSYAQAAGDTLQAPTALLAEISSVRPLPDPGWNCCRLTELGRPREVADDAVPPVTGEETVRGGAGTLQWQLNEPFAAFAYGRLGISRLYSIVPGLTPLVRGNLVHAALNHLYEELPSQVEIRAWDGDALSARISGAVDKAFSRYERRADTVLVQLLGLERARVSRLLRDVVAYDTTRRTFRIDAVEEKREFDAHGLVLQLRIDRIDRYDDGSIAILDYKTGSGRKFLDADGDPHDIQIMVYAHALADPVGTLGLYNVDSRKTELDAARRSAVDPGDWDERLQRWYGYVDQAAQALVAGDVRINLAKSSSELRPLSLLSRIGELKRDA